MTDIGCIFACTENSEKECLERKIFGAGKIHEDKVLDVKKGMTVFLYNLSSSVLFGPFKATTNGQKNIEQKIWRGMYPYQIRIKKQGKIKKISEFNKIEDILKLDWKNRLLDSKTTKILIKILNHTKIDLDIIYKHVEKNKPHTPPPI